MLETHDAADSSSLSGELPQYLLVCHARSISLLEGIWSFSLETVSGRSILDAEDHEEGDLNRLSLLAAVRGLEAIDGAAAVSLVSNNRYLIRSLDQSLPRWRENEFVWEHFGRKIAVQNADLWRRIDRTLDIHVVTASLVQTTRVSGTTPGIHGAGGRAADAAVADSARRSGESHAPELRIDAGHAEPLFVPSSDRFRRWLTGAEAAAVRPSRRGRYRPEDLAIGD